MIRAPFGAALACLWLCGLDHRAFAQTGQERVLTLEQALARARRANRTLVAERARLEQAQTNLEQAWAVLFPSVAAQGRYARNNIEFKFPTTSGSASGQPQVLTIQPYDQLDASLNVIAPVLAPPAYLGLDAVKAGIRSVAATVETSLASVLFSVAQAYYGAASADEVLAARLSSVEVARATLDNAQTRFAAGNVTRVDVDRAELALVRAEQSVREARFGKQQAYRALATLIEADGGFRVEPGGPPPANAPADSLDLAAALHLRPELRAVEELARSNATLVRAYAWRWAPTLSIFGNARLFNYDNFAREHHAWAVGAQLDWALFDGGARDAQRHLAAAQAREAAARAEVERETIRDELANARGLLETKRQALAAAERSVVLAVETLDLVRTQYETGSITQLDLLQAQDRLIAAKEELAQARFALALADVSLRRAAGTFPGT